MYFSQLPAIIFVYDIYTPCSGVVDYCLIIFILNGTLHLLCTFWTFALICKNVSHLYFIQHTSLPLHLTDVYKSPKHPHPYFFFHFSLSIHIPDRALLSLPFPFILAISPLMPHSQRQIINTRGSAFQVLLTLFFRKTP